MAHLTLSLRRGLTASVVVTLLAGLAVTIGATGPASADTTPPVAGDATNPATVTATPLPTVQINKQVSGACPGEDPATASPDPHFCPGGAGVVWSQAVIGTTVYVAGDFTHARPSGASWDSPDQTPRGNLLAFDIRTGDLVTSWAPSTNAQVLVIKASPDGSRLYIGGDFTTVNGQAQSRLAALDPTTGALVTAFKTPRPDARVRAIAFAGDTLYFGGHFGVAAGQTRSRLAAVRISDGALLSWAPAADFTVWALEVSPDQSQVLVAGAFATMNGSSKPGKGLASVDAVTGDLMPWAANDKLIRNGSIRAAITSLESHGDSVYATGYSQSDGGGTLEGTVRMSWDGGRVEWVADCHGDSYGVHAQGEEVYVVGHTHYCGNIPGGFHDEDPWKFHRATAFSQAPQDEPLRKEYGRWFNFQGNPAPSVLHWFPRLDGGTFTGMDQGAWTIGGSGDYVVAGGEFPRVGAINNALNNQYGLVRFARKGVDANPNTTRPTEGGAFWTPTVTSPGAGEALVSWRTNWDRDNAFLTYKVQRSDGSAISLVDTRTARSAEFARPYLSFLDTDLAPGTYNYRVRATDPDGNEIVSGWVPVTVSAGGGASDAYARAVTADGPQHYWRLGESSGTAVADYTGLNGVTAGSGVRRGVGGAVDGDDAARFDGAAKQSAATGTAETASFATTVEAWFRTSSDQGGRIVGLGNAPSGSSSGAKYDRHLYLDGKGRVNFGARQGNADASINQVVTSGDAYNDGRWHHAVGVVGDAGMTLYVDGTSVATRTDVTTGRYYTGYWRIGGDTLSGWPNRPPSDYFTGDIDEVAVYTHALTADQALQHYRTARTANQPPTAAFTATVSGSTVRFTSTSSDPDGTVDGYLWDFGDGTTSTQAGPTKEYAEAGPHLVTLTVTDNGGATASTTQQVVTAGVPGAPTGVSAVAGDARATVSWVAPASDGGAAVTKYTVRAYASGSSTAAQTLTVPASQLSAVVPGLSNGTSYDFRVAASNQVGEGAESAPSAAVTPVAPITAPGAPTGVSAVAGDARATVSWVAPASDGGAAVTLYTVRAYASGSSTAVQTLTVPASQLSAVVPGLSNGTSYVFRVAASNQVGEGAESAPSAAVTPVAPITAPGAPTGVSAVAGDARVTVSWVAPASDGGAAVTKYTVRAYASGSSTVAKTVSATGSQLSAVVDGLTNGTSYVFRVAASNQVGEGAESSPSAAVTPVAPAPVVTKPGAPSGVSAVAGDARATVSWVAPASDGGAAVTKYTVRAYVSGSSTVAKTVSATGSQLSAVVEGLTNGTSYVFRVAASNQVGEGAESAPSAAVKPAAPATSRPVVDRLQGADRYETAVRVSAATFGAGVPVAYVVGGGNFPDALAAGPAAARAGGPVLLVERDSVPSVVLAELRRLKPGRIVVVGGSSVVSDSVVATLRGVSVTSRVAGPGRYDTAAAVARDAFGSGASVAFLATGEGFADALAAAPVAAAQGAPILLTQKASLPEATAQALRVLGVRRVVVIGGTGAVSADVEASLRAMGLEVQRVAGADRYETAAKVVRLQFRSAGRVFLATGANYPDALGGGAAAGYLGVPLLLTQPSCMPPATSSLLSDLAASRVTVLGGTGAVGDAAASGGACSG